MAETKQFICVGCPVGCPLELDHEGDRIVEVVGYECDRGAKYAKQEFTDPRRALATTVAISGARWARLPVKASGHIPKDRIMEAARQVHLLRVEAPVMVGQVLMQRLLGEEGVDVVATRSMERVR